MPDPWPIFDRIGKPFRYLRGVFTGRVAAEQASKEQRRQVLRDLGDAMAEALTESGWIAAGYIKSSEDQHRDVGRRAEMRAGNLATEVPDETLRNHVQAFRSAVQSIFDETQGGASWDERRAMSRKAYEAALGRLAELQDELR